MKFLTLLALVAVSRAGVVPVAPAVHAVAPAVLETGASVQHRTQDDAGNYAFAYDEAHTTGGSFRRETGNALGIVKGSYGLKDADGRQRIVNYIADDAGFRANIQTNEPGVDPSRDPAATLINKGAVAPVAPAAAVVAPTVAAVAPAPVVAHAPAYGLAHYAPAAIASYSTVQHHAAPVAVAAAAPAVHYAEVPAHGYGYYRHHQKVIL